MYDYVHDENGDVQNEAALFAKNDCIHHDDMFVTILCA
jgi:hypothetical protein